MFEIFISIVLFVYFRAVDGPGLQRAGPGRAGPGLADTLIKTGRAGPNMKTGRAGKFRPVK